MFLSSDTQLWRAWRTVFKHTICHWRSDNHKALTGICSVLISSTSRNTVLILTHGDFTPLFQRQQCPIQPLWLWPDTGPSLAGYAKPAGFLVFCLYYGQIGVSGAQQRYTVLHLQVIVHCPFSPLFSSVASHHNTFKLAFGCNSCWQSFDWWKATQERAVSQLKPN